MKVLKVLAIMATVSASGFAMAESQVVDSGNSFESNQLIPTGVRAEVGTTGYGAALLWTANPYVGLALGYNGGDISWSDDIKINGSKYDLDMKNKLAYLNAEIRPWGASDNRWAQAFYVAGGIGYLENDYKLDRRVNGVNNFSVGKTDFQSTAEGVHINGKLNYKNDFAPYVGLGYAPKITNNFGVFGEFGAYYTGNPDVSLNRVSGSATNNNGVSLDSALAREANDIRNDDEHAWLPVGKIGVSYHW